MPSSILQRNCFSVLTLTRLPLLWELKVQWKHQSGLPEVVFLSRRSEGDLCPLWKGFQNANDGTSLKRGKVGVIVMTWSVQGLTASDWHCFPNGKAMSSGMVEPMKHTSWLCLPTNCLLSGHIAPPKSQFLHLNQVKSYWEDLRSLRIQLKNLQRIDALQMLAVTPDGGDSSESGQFKEGRCMLLLSGRLPHRRAMHWVWLYGIQMESENRGTFLIGIVK